MPLGVPHHFPRMILFLPCQTENINFSQKTGDHSIYYLYHRALTLGVSYSAPYFNYCHNLWDI